MDKSYEGFLQSSLLWTDEQFGLEQFVIRFGELDYSRLRPIPNKLRLGHQVEHIFFELLKYSNHYKVLAHSVQLIQYKQTLGELDFIIKDLDSNQIYHIELAYKFYLLDPNMEGPIQGLVGPNRSDAFTYKLHKTIHKQMPLLYSDAARERLKIDVDSVKQMVAFYAQIYVPFDMQCRQIGTLNANSVKGVYMNLEQFMNQGFESLKFHFPSKNEWIHIPYANVKWMNYEAALDYIIERHISNRSPMLWVDMGNGVIDKMFITHWS